jgi:hypothetical protein
MNQIRVPLHDESGNIVKQRFLEFLQLYKSPIAHEDESIPVEQKFI